MERSDETGCQPEVTGRRKQYIVTDNYIGIMIESLRRKKDVLTDILKLSEEQSLLLDDPNLEPDTFEKNVNRKAALIDKLEQLDTGFESLYDKVKEELESNRDIHKEQIRQMQELIRALTELNMQIQATEARNKERTTKTGEPIYDVEATIYCLKKSHKGIIIGKDGNMLKRIASYARTDLEKMLDIKINLKVWVKVKEDWLNNDTLVKKFKLQ